MIRTTMKIDGMSCGMCEAHVNDVIRRMVPAAKKVASSYKKGESTFLTEEAVEEAGLRAAIEETGYHVLSFTAETAQKKGLFSRG